MSEIDFDKLEAALIAEQKQKKETPIEFDFDRLEAQLDKEFPQQKSKWGDPEIGRGAALAANIANGLTFGFGDEIDAGLKSIPAIFNSETVADVYDRELVRNRRMLEGNKEAHPIASGAGELAGAIAVPAGVGAKALQKANGFGRRVLAGAGIGAADGALVGFGSAEGGFDERADNAVNTAKVGAILGGVGTPVIDGIAKVAKPALGIGKEGRVLEKIAGLMDQSEQSPKVINSKLMDAANEGQPEYALVDALGETGRSALNGAARSGGHAREITEKALYDRQLNQGDRIGAFLADGLGVTETATQMGARLSDDRSRVANELYDTARNEAGEVHLRDAFKTIDDRVGVGADTSTLDPIAAKLASYSERLKSSSPLGQFDNVLNVKRELQDDIGAAVRAGRNNEARELGLLLKQLDTSLESSSTGYRAANDVFRQKSKEIDAIDQGANFARPSNRAADNVEQFNGMSPDQQKSARVGYGDKLIGRLENARTGADKSAPLMTDKATAELKAFANDPEKLTAQLRRESEMVKTRNWVAGGSKTADNLMDIRSLADNAGAIQSLFQGRPIAAATSALGSLGNALTGQTPEMRKRLVEKLLATGDAKELFEEIQKHKNAPAKIRNLLAMALSTSGNRMVAE